MSGDRDDESDDEPLTLNADALSILNSVIGSGQGGGHEDDHATLARLLRQRRAAESSSSESESDDGNDGNDGNDETALTSGESHADYYKRLYPERYASGTTKKEEEEEDDDERPMTAVVTLEDEYVRDLVLAALRRRTRWRVTTEVPSNDDDDYRLHWGEYEDLRWFSSAFESGRATVSCYYNRKGLVRKGHLAALTEKFRAKRGRALSPTSRVLQLPVELGPPDDDDGRLDDAVYRDALSAAGIDPDVGAFPDGRVRILKPSVTNRAVGLRLVASDDDLRRALAETDELQRAGDLVLQDYAPPLLLDGRKFHLRVFLLLRGSLVAYVFTDLLAIFSLEPYDADDLDNDRAHLTNIAHQLVLTEEDHHRCMRRLDETTSDIIVAGLAGTEEEARCVVDKIRDRVLSLTTDLVGAVDAELTFAPRDNCFELFGLDFLVDPNLDVWLLEANAEPDLSKAGDRLQPVIDNVLEDTLALVLGERDDEDDDKNATRSYVKVYERKGRSF